MVNKRRQVQAKRWLGRVFTPKFQATRQLRKEFQTSFRFLTKVTNFKHNDICAESFDANFEQQDSFARCFTQALPSEQYGLICSKKTVAQSVLTPFSSYRTVAHDVLDKFQLLNKVASFKQKDSCAESFDANFNQLHSCTRCFRQVLDFQQKCPISSKMLTAQSVLTQSFSNRTVAQGLLNKVQLLKKVASFKQNDSCAESFDVNFNNLDSCARCFKKALAF